MAGGGSVVNFHGGDADEEVALADPLEEALGPATDGIVIDDDANIRRVKALAATVPIEELDRTKGNLSGGFWGLYDLRTLAMAAIEWVALALGVSSGASPTTTTSFLVSQAARQQPDRDPEEHHQVAARVLDRLVEEVTSRYVDLGTTPPTSRDFAFRLVYEQLSASGSVHLRVSEQAINVLVHALDLNIADAQEAEEARMQRFVQRGMLGKAGEGAHRSRLRSIQFLERVQSIVRDTASDITAHDWGGKVAESWTSA
jgi:hypothetical protein